MESEAVGIINIQIYSSIEMSRGRNKVEVSFYEGGVTIKFKESIILNTLR